MRNFMEAYTAVHSKEAKEELDSQRDPISEMNTASLQDNDLRELAEEILEEVFKTSTVKEAEDIIYNMIPESNIVGREEKLERIYAAFGETFSRIKLKSNEGQLEEFAKYRRSKRLEETWSARHNQDKRVARVHSTVVAEDKETIKKGLLGLFNEKKSDPCWVGYKQVGMKKKGGKQVPNCVPANEAAQYDEMYKGKHGQSEKEYQDSRSDAGKMISGDSKGSGANYSYKAKNTGPNPAGGSKKPQGQAKMGKKDRDYLAYRKASMKKEEFVSEKKGSKPDYLDFDGDGNKEESMKKALKDKKHSKMKEELELSGKFSETEILKIIASL